MMVRYENDDRVRCCLSQVANNHSSTSYQPHIFVFFPDTGSSATEVMQGIFVFPDSRVIQRGDYSMCLTVDIFYLICFSYY